jgi:hypothetical protein
MQPKYYQINAILVIANRVIIQISAELPIIPEIHKINPTAYTAPVFLAGFNY